MTTSQQFNDDASATRKDRFESDKQRLLGWIASLKDMERLFDHLRLLKGDGFSFITNDRFNPSSTALDQDYAAPKLERTITFVKGKEIFDAPSSFAKITLNADCKYTFEAEGTNFAGETRAHLLQSVESWVSGLNSQYPELNILGHVQRADTTPARVNSPVKSKPKPA